MNSSKIQEFWISWSVTCLPKPLLNRDSTVLLLLSDFLKKKQTKLETEFWAHEQEVDRKRCKNPQVFLPLLNFEPFSLAANINFLTTWLSKKAMNENQNQGWKMLDDEFRVELAQQFFSSRLTDYWFCYLLMAWRIWLLDFATQATFEPNRGTSE